MSKLEVDVKSIQGLIRSRALNAKRSLSKLETQAQKVLKEWVKKGLDTQKEGRKQVEGLVKVVRDTVSSSELIKNLKKSDLYHKALEAKDEFEKRVVDAQKQVYKILNVPTKQELDRLNRKVDDLGRKLNKKGKTTSPEVKKSES